MKISFSPPDITEAEINEVAEALRSGWITTGPRTKQLEKQIAEWKEIVESVEEQSLVRNKQQIKIKNSYQ